jgi:predicted Zn-dependent protease with MMP-like domain
LSNVAIVVEDWPTAKDMDDAGLDEGDTLLGLYQGTPLTGRTSDYGLTLPDKITIFQGPIEQMCPSDWKIQAEVQVTVVHELAHHFGISDETLHHFGLG